MTDETPKRPWWRKRRWWAAGLLWLTVTYPPSFGPFVYAAERGWLPNSVLPAAYVFYLPLAFALESSPTLMAVAQSYETWWSELAQRHGGRPRYVMPSGPANVAPAGPADQPIDVEADPQPADVTPR